MSIAKRIYMSMRKKLRKYKIGTILIILIIVLSGCSQKKGVLVIVKNNSGGDIRNLIISYVGGSTGCDLLGDKQTFSDNVNPVSESALSIQFLDKNGEIRKNKVDTYMEKNYKGRIEITIEPDYSLTVKDNIHV